ncbi:unnamed protein product [Paramecium octaurelia]|uniref:MORN repeat protein n=1 Tax=Paramecium octaurelia TaxID=43137 RepID=A0A8S1XZE7_PAROT|nr:unnamed protein product [Paramecium octaurelia]
MFIVYPQPQVYLVQQTVPVYQSLPFIRPPTSVQPQIRSQIPAQIASPDKSRVTDVLIETINKKIEIIDSRICQIQKSLPPKQNQDGNNTKKQHTNTSQDEFNYPVTPQRNGNYKSYFLNKYDNSQERIRISKKILEEHERNTKASKNTQSSNKRDQSFQSQTNNKQTTYDINKKTTITKKIIYMGEEALYEGQTDERGRKQGIGTLFDKDGKIIYTGQWKDDVFWGKGKLMFRESKSQKLQLKNFMNFSNVAKNRETYSGNFINGEIEGIGQMQFIDCYDSYFVFYGTFRKGVFHGKGCVLSNQGRESLEGEWVNGRHT